MLEILSILYTHYYNIFRNTEIFVILHENRSALQGRKHTWFAMKRSFYRHITIEEKTFERTGISQFRVPRLRHLLRTRHFIRTVLHLNPIFQLHAGSIILGDVDTASFRINHTKTTLTPSGNNSDDSLIH